MWKYLKVIWRLPLDSTFTGSRREFKQAKILCLGSWVQLLTIHESTIDSPCGGGLHEWWRVVWCFSSFLFVSASVSLNTQTPKEKCSTSAVLYMHEVLGAFLELHERKIYLHLQRMSSLLKGHLPERLQHPYVFSMQKVKLPSHVDRKHAYH